METNNVVLLRGTITREPVVRDLPAGGRVTQVDVSTQVDGRVASVTVSVDDRIVTAVAGDQVVVTGHVRRRFFRAGGVTQSRTEVVAADVIKASRRRTVQRAIDSVLDAIAADDEGG